MQYFTTKAHTVAHQQAYKNLLIAKSSMVPCVAGQADEQKRPAQPAADSLAGGLFNGNRFRRETRARAYLVCTRVAKVM